MRAAAEITCGCDLRFDKRDLNATPMLSLTNPGDVDRVGRPLFDVLTPRRSRAGACQNLPRRHAVAAATRPPYTMIPNGRGTAPVSGVYEETD